MPPAQTIVEIVYATLLGYVECLGTPRYAIDTEVKTMEKKGNENSCYGGLRAPVDDGMLNLIQNFLRHDIGGYFVDTVQHKIAISLTVSLDNGFRNDRRIIQILHHKTIEEIKNTMGAVVIVMDCVLVSYNFLQGIASGSL